MNESCVRDCKRAHRRGLCLFLYFVDYCAVVVVFTLIELVTLLLYESLRWKRTILEGALLLNSFGRARIQTSSNSRPALCISVILFDSFVVAVICASISGHATRQHERRMSSIFSSRNRSLFNFIPASSRSSIIKLTMNEAAATFSDWIEAHVHTLPLACRFFLVFLLFGCRRRILFG